jgi:type IV pilus assembly protein PilB
MASGSTAGRVELADQDSKQHSGGGKPAKGKPTRLGDILLQHGDITQQQLDHALAQQKTLKLPLGQTLMKLNYLTDETMRQALSQQLGIPFIDLEKVMIDRSLAKVVNRSYARRHSLLPVAQVGRTLTVAMDNPADSSVIEELGRLTKFSITTVTSSSKAIQRAFRRLYEEMAETAEVIGAEKVSLIDSSNDDAAQTGPIDEQVSRQADELFRYLLHQAIQRHCSDIHIEMMPTGLHVRFRIDGVLRPPNFGQAQQQIDKNMREIVSRIKILGNLDIAERRRPQDGSFSVQVDRGGSPVSIDLRISVVPSYYGESVVIRILDRTRAPKSIDELDLSPPVVEGLSESLKRTTGIFLVTGPTGSGKSTTLYACLMRLHTPEVRILTAEDPVEYVYDELSQSEVNKSIGNTFAAYLRAFLRHDPEVIMVGEIRDQETAEMSFRAAQTGHLLLSTLHTNSAIAALPRLRDLNIESSLIASSLIGVISQRLVRKICDNCREEYTPAATATKDFFDRVPEGFKFYKGAGCDYCGFSGYNGRMMVADLWVPDDEDMMLITRQAPFDEVRASAMRTTFSMAQDANARLKGGRTTMEELLRVLPYSAIAEHRERFSA